MLEAIIGANVFDPREVLQNVDTTVAHRQTSSDVLSFASALGLICDTDLATLITDLATLIQIRNMMIKTDRAFRGPYVYISSFIQLYHSFS